MCKRFNFWIYECQNHLYRGLNIILATNRWYFYVTTIPNLPHHLIKSSFTHIPHAVSTKFHQNLNANENVTYFPKVITKRFLLPYYCAWLENKSPFKKRYQHRKEERFEPFHCPTSKAAERLLTCFAPAEECFCSRLLIISIVSEGSPSHSFPLIENTRAYKGLTISILSAISIRVSPEWPLSTRRRLPRPVGCVEKSWWWMERCRVYGASLSWSKRPLTDQERKHGSFPRPNIHIPGLCTPVDKCVYTVRDHVLRLCSEIHPPRRSLCKDKWGGKVMWKCQLRRLVYRIHPPPPWGLSMGKHVNIWTAPEKFVIPTYCAVSPFKTPLRPAEKGQDPLFGGSKFTSADKEMTNLRL